MLEYYEVRLIDKKLFETKKSITVKPDDYNKISKLTKKYEEQGYIVAVIEVRTNTIYFTEYDVNEISITA